MEIEQIYFLGQVSTVMRALTNKNGDLLVHFDNINERNTLAILNCTPFNQMLIDNMQKQLTNVKSKVIFNWNIFCDSVKQLKRLLKT